ncbi:unnamed protein product, partial [Musa textilis]
HRPAEPGPYTSPRRNPKRAIRPTYLRPRGKVRQGVRKTLNSTFSLNGPTKGGAQRL